MAANKKNTSGSGNGNCRLSEADVLAIRRLHGVLSDVKIAAQFKTSRANVYQIVRGLTWKDLEGPPQSSSGNSTT